MMIFAFKIQKKVNILDQDQDIFLIQLNIIKLETYNKVMNSTYITQQTQAMRKKTRSTRKKEYIRAYRQRSN